MKFTRREYNNPWLCAGDFNEVLYASEQFGGNAREEWTMEGFSEMVDYCRFDDLGYYGLPYTWDNRQQGTRNFKVRLDRGLGDDKFLECFHNTTVNHIQCTESDHCALLIAVRRSDWMDEARLIRPFRFENAWTRHDTYNQVVHEAWTSGCHDLASLYGALGVVRNRLQNWSKSEFGSVKKQIRTMRQKLEIFACSYYFIKGLSLTFCYIRTSWF